jgi:hypothetical protein
MATRDDGADGESVSVVVSDPWEFGDAHGTSPRGARVVRRLPFGDSCAMVLLFDQPIDFDGLRYEYVLTTPRQGRYDLDAERHRESAFVNLTAMPSDAALTNDPLAAAPDLPEDHLIGTIHWPERTQKVWSCGPSHQFLDAR